MRDLYNNISIQKVIAPVVVSDNTAAVGTVIDRLGFESVTFAIATGTLADADATFAVLLEESNASGSDFAAVADADLIGTEAGATISGGASDGQIAKIGYIGVDRYLTVDLTVGGTATGVHSVMAVLGDPINAPQSTQKA